MKIKNHKKIVLYLVIVFVFILCGIIYVFSDNMVVSETVEGFEIQGIDMEETLLIAEHYNEETDSMQSTGSELFSGTDIVENKSESLVYVYICGSVVSPGVYEICEGSRLFEIIELAGGATVEAYVEALNLAEPVYDGQKIYVPTYEEFCKNIEDDDIYGYHLEDNLLDDNKIFEKDIGIKEDNNLININTAGVSILTTLPGIGDARAATIIEYREKYGEFEKIEDIMKVPGIKEAAFDKIKEFICTQK